MDPGHAISNVLNPAALFFALGFAAVLFKTGLATFMSGLFKGMVIFFLLDTGMHTGHLVGLFKTPSPRSSSLAWSLRWSAAARRRQEAREGRGIASRRRSRVMRADQIGAMAWRRHGQEGARASRIRTGSSREFSRRRSLATGLPTPPPLPPGMKDGPFRGHPHRSMRSPPQS